MIRVARAGSAGLTGQLLAGLGPLAECESPSHDPDVVGRCADLVAGYGESLLAARPERLFVDGHPHLRWHWPAEHGAGRVLVLCHLDTVWPPGSIDVMPWTVVGDVARRPGRSG